MAMSDAARAHRLSMRYFVALSRLPKGETVETTAAAIERSHAVRQARAERIAAAKAARPQPQGQLMGSRYQGGYVGSPLSAR